MLRCGTLFRTAKLVPGSRGPLLSVRGLSKDYGELRVVSSLTFDVREGELLGVIGPNMADLLERRAHGKLVVRP